MCGRLNMAVDPGDLVSELDIDANEYDYAPRYNVPPGAVLPIVVERADAEGEVLRSLQPARWGLVPGWAKEEKIGFKAFNARSETVDSKPMFRRAFGVQRCAVPVGGYYEWQTDEAGKTPWLMHAADGGQLLMAGLFEFRRQPHLDTDGDEGGTESSDPAIRRGWLVSTTIVTAASSGHLADVHDRMPVMMTPDRIREWIDPAADAARARTVLDSVIAGFDPGSVERFRVGSDVGNVRNQSEGLASPIDDVRIR